MKRNLAKSVVLACVLACIAAAGGVGAPQPAAWTAAGEGQFDLFGSSIACAGDVNGDGFDDVIVGAPWYSFMAGDFKGRVYVYYGTPGGPSSTPSWFIDGEFWTGAGQCVAGAGDVDKDGYADIVIAEEYGGMFGCGAARLFRGGPGGLSPAATTAAEADWSYEFTDFVSCESVALGDVNGDGVSDVIVGAPGPGMGCWGRVLVFYGHAGGVPSAAPDRTIAYDGDDSRSRIGWVVASAGDVNGDGCDDILVGMDPVIQIPAGNVIHDGAVSLYLGGQTSTSTPVWTPAWTISGGVNPFSINGQATGGGDVNGDGYDDVLARGNVNGWNAALLYYGGPGGLTDSGWWWPVTGMGREFSIVGDINCDGFDDIVVNGGYEMPANVYYGGPGGPSGTVDLQLDGYAETISAGGDVNGDGSDDILLSLYYGGADWEGEVRMFTGLNRRPNAPSSCAQYQEDGATPIPAGGTLEGDKVVLKATCSDPGGESVALEIEIRPTGEAFKGLPTHAGTSVASGKVASVIVTGLAPGSYHWQAATVDLVGSASAAWTKFGTSGADFVIPEIQSTGKGSGSVARRMCGASAAGFVPGLFGLGALAIFAMAGRRIA